MFLVLLTCDAMPLANDDISISVTVIVEVACTGTGMSRLLGTGNKAASSLRA